MRDIRRSWSTGLACVVCICLLTLSACDDEKSVTEPDLRLPPQPTSPENLLEALEFIYNDTVRSADERLRLYADLFPPADQDSLSFIFRFQMVDTWPGEPFTWGLDSELQAHENIFRAQDNKDIFSLELSIQYEPATEFEFPDPGQEDWQVVFATNIFIRLMFNPQDGLLVDGGQGRFLCAPTNGRWYICDWADLPRPFAQAHTAAVEPNTWGSIKALFD